MPILLRKDRMNLGSQGVQTRATAVGVDPFNHHAIIDRHNVNSRLGFLTAAQSRTSLGYISLSSHHAKQFSLPHMPQHSAVSIHQMDWADTLGIIAPYPNPFSSHPMEVFWSSGNCLECPSIQLTFANEPNPNGSPHRH